MRPELGPEPNHPRMVPGARSDSVTIDAKVRFLGTPAAYPGQAGPVSAKETHMSWVFLAGDRVFKLKKPVRFPHLDFTTLAARERNCREEVRLNLRLAPHVYLGVVPLTAAPDGSLAVCGEGTTVDWLVCMRRLPASDMLDVRIGRGRVANADLDRIAATLERFYRTAEPADIAPEAYAQRFAAEQAINRDVLTRREFTLDHGRVPAVLERLERSLSALRQVLEDRVRLGQVVDGHGDLRPEHVCLTDPIVIFDCLEFSRELRWSDPFDEIAFLGLECELLGAAWIGPSLARSLSERLGSHPSTELTGFYRAFRAVMRARLTIAHLLDPVLREPAKWEPLAMRYLSLAEGTLSAMTTAGC